MKIYPEDEKLAKALHNVHLLSINSFHKGTINTDIVIIT